MVSVTKAIGQNMDRAFLAKWQPNIGRGIVVATQENEKRSTLRQEQLGTAIVEMATVQEVYEPVRAAIQEQLGSATVVALRTGSQQGVATSDRLTADRVAALSAQDVLPRISTTTFIVASLILISLFTTGLFVLSSRGAGIPQNSLVQALVPSKLS